MGLLKGGDTWQVNHEGQIKGIHKDKGKGVPDSRGDTSKSGGACYIQETANSSTVTGVVVEGRVSMHGVGGRGEDQAKKHIGATLRWAFNSHAY